MLIDRARIFVKSGDGGNGSSSFRREKFVPRGGPDGGDGGRGGSVLLRVRPSITSLLKFQYNEQFKAERGGSGRSQKRFGKSGQSLYIDVPAGTVVWDDESGELWADLTDDGEEVVVARGGRGGLGNVHFKTSTRQAPRIAELGEPGQERWLRLELRLIADVGLVGLPNAGKSTLLAAASAARPKIADYPFTTLEPNLGVVEVGGTGGQAFVLADIPGLIEGAATGSGLGHEFLRHITRTKVLVHVLDASGGLEGRDPLADFATITDELSAYSVDDLSEKPMMVALNKVDLAEARAHLDTLRAEFQGRGLPVYEVSAATGKGVPELMRAVAERLRAFDEVPVPKPQHAAERRLYTLDNVDERAWTVDRLAAHQFSVRGIGIERFTKMTNFALEDSLRRFQRVLESSGISGELERLGVEPGDVVNIGDHELVWGEHDDFAAIPDHVLPQAQKRRG
ncbi:MAG: GTPase ObgE [Chloroflexota bacterium]|nr:GTPase ObgE [Chloroflexota bacterium]